MAPEQAPVSKLPGLDGLRAVAALLVLFFHQLVLPFGWVGVQIFFVLSGYLITRSLYRSRGETLGTYLKVFYGRRSLRIFPLYFGVCALLALTLALGARSSGVSNGLPYAATYTYNFYHASRWFEHSRFIAHFWSLCVEEQFYLLWPFFIFFCPERKLKLALTVIVCSGPLIRLVSFQILSLPGVPAWHNTPIAVYALTTSHIDAFAVGALVSLYPRGGMRSMLYASLGLVVAAGLCVVFFAPSADGRLADLAAVGYPVGLRHGYAFVWGYSLLNISSALLIDCLVFDKFAPRFFGNPVLQHVGKVSYGFYVLHYPIQSLVSHLPAGLFAQIAVQVLLTTALATASFYWWETPFLRLKERWFSAHPPSIEGDALTKVPITQKSFG